MDGQMANDGCATESTMLKAEKLKDEPVAIGTSNSTAKGWIRQQLTKAWHLAFPYDNVRREFIGLMRLAGPTLLMYVAHEAFHAISFMFVGHVGQVELGGVALAASVKVLTTYVCVVGLNSACDTLFSQSFGSGNKKRVGFFMQQAVLLAILLCLLCFAIFLCAGKLLLAMGQDPAVVLMTDAFLVWNTPDIPGLALFHLLSKYLQTQDIVFPTLLVAIFGNLCNAALQAFFILYLKLGVKGAAIGLWTTSWIMVAMLLIYIFRWKVYRPTWAPVTMAILDDWWPMLKLLVPAIAGTFVEFMVFELGVICSGLVGKLELAVQTSVYYVCVLSYMMPLGFSIAVAIKLGQALGAGDLRAASTLMRLAVTVSLAIGITGAVFVNALAHPLSYIYTSDAGVARNIVTPLRLAGSLLVFDSICAGLIGILRGCGKQKPVAIQFFGGYYLVGLPVALPLLFLTSTRVAGLWIGFGCGAMVNAVGFGLCVWRVNWTKEINKARKRAGVMDTDAQQTETRKVTNKLTAQNKGDCSDDEHNAPDGLTADMKLANSDHGGDGGDEVVDHLLHPEAALNMGSLSSILCEIYLPVKAHIPEEIQLLSERVPITILLKKLSLFFCAFLLVFCSLIVRLVFPLSVIGDSGSLTNGTLLVNMTLLANYSMT